MQQCPRNHPSLPGSSSLTLESSASNNAEPRRQTLRFWFKRSVLWFVFVNTNRIPVGPHFKGPRVWELRACSYCGERRKTTKRFLPHTPRWTALASLLRLQAVGSNPSFHTSKLCNLWQVSLTPRASSSVKWGYSQFPTQSVLVRIKRANVCKAFSRH